MRVRLLVLVMLLVTACSGMPRHRAEPTPTPAPLLPTTHKTVWLCQPGLPKNPCEGGLDATAVGRNGSRKHEDPPVRTQAVDCFYVYPTVSPSKRLNAPLVATAAEVRTARAQVGRFSSVCRVFAPVYRQITVNALLTGRYGDRAGRALSHADVVSAWHDYLNRNPGRRFVLIGHSQGSLELLRLIQEEIDGHPDLRSRLVSALLLGGNVKVPPGKDVGGDLQNVPLCRSARQQGCLVTYNTYDATPPRNALFGKADPARGLVAACTNPSALAGGVGALVPYFPTAKLGTFSAVLGSFDTGFVTYPGYLTAACRQQNGAAWLQVALHRTGHDTRPLLPKALGAAWGLHLYDVNLALGNLVNLVRAESS